VLADPHHGTRVRDTALQRDLGKWARRHGLIFAHRRGRATGDRGGRR
jgi:hypothetical protein